MDDSKAIPDLVVVKHREGKTSEPEPSLKRRVAGLQRKTISRGARDGKRVGRVSAQPSARSNCVRCPWHLKISCQGKIFELRTGDTFVVRGGVEHGASALKTRWLSMSSHPCREDYLT